MLKSKYPLNSEFSKIIKELFPVTKKRPPYWFFKQEAIAAANESKSRGEKHEPTPKRVSSLETWRNLRPEGKRKYFQMAIVDALRYREQKNSWISHVGFLLAKHDNQTDKVIKELEQMSKETIEKEIISETVSQRLDLEEMIDVATTKHLYKCMANDSSGNLTNLSKEELISEMPKDLRFLINRPKRPKCAFLLFADDQRDKIKDTVQSSTTKVSHLKVAANMWYNLTKDEKLPYEQKYLQNLSDYKKAMAEYESKHDYKLLDQARKEKKLFKKSLKKKLKESMLQPLNPRNAFNFFVMHRPKKELTMAELIDVWRELPEDEKRVYKEMSEEDHERYEKEKKAVEKAMKNLTSSLCDSKTDTGAQEQ